MLKSVMGGAFKHNDITKCENLTADRKTRHNSFPHQLPLNTQLSTMKESDYVLRGSVQGHV